MSEDTVLGIDLGTTNSAMAYIAGGDPETIPNSKGNRTTPSVVAVQDIDGREEVHVGEPAKNSAVKNPDRTAQSIKRHMGKDDHVVQLGSREFTPEEVSARILQKIKADAEDYLGEEISRAVITVPAYFSDNQRLATKNAGEIAGFDVERIVSEPTAAALAYGLGDIDEQRRVLVFDLGGGTFDVSVLKLSDSLNETIATDGDKNLGGDDWDQILIEYIADTFEEKNGIDLRDDPQALQRLKENAEQAKKDLSDSPRTKIDIPFITTGENTGPVHVDQELTRGKFEELTEHLVDRIKDPTEQVLEDAPFGKEELDNVILVGGSTRMQVIKERVELLTGITPEKSVNPDEAVALGAAIQGGIVSDKFDDLVLLDVTPLSLGVEVQGGLFEPIIQRNTTIPTSQSKPFTTAQDNQRQVQINVYQGEREIAKENEFLGNFTLSGIPQAPAGAPQIDVSFRINEDGIVHVEATDEGSGQTETVVLEGVRGISEEEIEKMKQEAEEYAEEDERRRRRVEARNEASSAIRRAKTHLDERDDVSPGARNRISGQVETLENLLDSEDAIIEDFEEGTEKLTELLQEINTTAQEQADESGTSDDVEIDNSDTDNQEAPHARAASFGEESATEEDDQEGLNLFGSDSGGSNTQEGDGSDEHQEPPSQTTDGTVVSPSSNEPVDSEEDDTGDEDVATQTDDDGTSNNTLR